MAIGSATRHPLVEAVEALEPRIAAAADEIERTRRVPDDLIQALGEAGVFRMLVPASLGGGEVDPVTQMEVLESIARADGSAGWVSAILSGTAWTTSYLRPDVAAEILADPDTRLAGTLAIASGGRAVATDGGYVLSGRWPFGSGTQHAHWLISRSVVFEGDAPKRDEATGTPVTRVLVFPRSEATILDTWDVTGLSGTGSNDYTVSELFVPEERTFELSGLTPYHQGPLYLGRFFLLAHGAHALGIARAAVDALTAMMTTKREGASGAGALVRDRVYVQVAVAQAEALVRGGRAYLWEATRQIWEEAVTTGTIGAESRALARLANSAAFDNSLRAIDLMYTVGGGAAVYRTNPLQRYFRDIHTASQHSVVGPGTIEQIGHSLLAQTGVDRATGRPLL
jgi:alkylation response protein AidB-like acyl-CoA dehydrogenase